MPSVALPILTGPASMQGNARGSKRVSVLLHPELLTQSAGGGLRERERPGVVRGKAAERPNAAPAPLRVRRDAARPARQRKQSQPCRPATSQQADFDNAHPDMRLQGRGSTEGLPVLVDQWEYTTRCCCVSRLAEYIRPASLLGRTVVLPG